MQTILQVLTVVLVIIDSGVSVVLLCIVARDSTENRLDRAEHARIRAVLSE